MVIGYTGKECDVVPYREDYKAVKNVPISHVATAWQSIEKGEVYILVFGEGLWMGDSMTHSLVNPNHLRHYGINVQDDPTSKSPLNIITSDGEFAMPLRRKGTVIYFEIHTPTPQELESNPHIHLSSQQPWNPESIVFPVCSHSMEEEVDRIRQVGTVGRNAVQGDCYGDSHTETNRCIFDLSRITRCISSMSTHEGEVGQSLAEEREETEAGGSDVKELPTFESGDRHTDVSANDLSQRWHISVKQASQTLKRTTQRFLRSPILPLSRRYRADRMFQRKTLSGR